MRVPDKPVDESSSALHTPSLPQRQVLDQESFWKTIAIERKRAERSRNSFLLMILQKGSDLRTTSDAEIFTKIIFALATTTRETDVIGWYQVSSAVSVIFTELGLEPGAKSMIKTLTCRVNSALEEHLTESEAQRLRVSCYLFPEEGDRNGPEDASNAPLYPDLIRRDRARKFFSTVKRVIDVFGSLLLLILSGPLFCLAALAVKLTSRGPVFYRQQRIGQYGRRFAMLKFRSMYENSDSSTHREYVQQLIAGVAARHSGNGGGQGVYKLTRDSRVTPVGAFLRRTSLDELPQAINVIKGEMSLVGPRPPVEYEVDRYELWHRRRLMEMKPGITGLWQVSGRNRLSFNEMVRLDLRYAKVCTPWLDLKILFQTPRAVIEGAH